MDGHLDYKEPGTPDHGDEVTEWMVVSVKVSPSGEMVCNVAEEQESEPHRPQPRLETSFWKHVREYLERREGPTPNQVPPIAVCPICRVTELDILGLPPSSSDVANMQPALVTVCGHMACYDCLGACIQGYLIPRNSDLHGAAPDNIAYLQDVPRTLPEDGIQPERCNHCLDRRAMNTKALKTVQRLRAMGPFTDEEAEVWINPRVTADWGILQHLHDMAEGEDGGWGEQWDRDEIFGAGDGSI
ncbi:hypothetical protein C8A00DRAFT_37498 [Chaetomidium leptoderma]|uniref:Uncharacterized protein n=1 Tax=Chaetomidium leptoderma TaxID=669021 RepID=A0AAN6VF30_9PEZI|nr:hypothetical protein C8A00DRAFT_37498 [Chaetomidium leptoderma]